jgi:hypothetical protein
MADRDMTIFLKKEKSGKQGIFTIPQMQVASHKGGWCKKEETKSILLKTIISS